MEKNGVQVALNLADQVQGWFHPLAAGAGAGVPLFPGTGRNGVRAERLPDSSKSFAHAGWFHSLRRSGTMVTAIFSASKRGQKEVGAGGGT